MNKMYRSELLEKCKKLGIKGVTTKTKAELLYILREEEHIQILSCSSLNDVLIELITQTQKDKPRKVCKNCGELGHNVTSTICKINIDKNNKLKQKIKTYILSQNCLEDKTIDDYCTELSILLYITPNACKTLYSEIPASEWLDKQMNIGVYFESLNQSTKNCHECDKNMICLQINTHRIWKGNELCDTCWSKYDGIRKTNWEKVKEYRVIQCEICRSIQNHSAERYHYDHLNMFHKDQSVCTMINEGSSLEEIYNEIDKCQILCLSCHHIVTDIEHKLCFTRIKQSLTKSLNQKDIDEEEYYRQTQSYQKIYEEKMKHIYEELKQIL